MGRKSDYETFIEKYKPDMMDTDEDDEQIKLYETYEKDWEEKAGEGCKFLWTLVETDNDRWYIIPGFHYVNRLNYIITQVPWDEKSRDYRY